MLLPLTLLWACTEQPEGPPEPPEPSLPPAVEQEMSSLLSGIVDGQLPAGATFTVSAPAWGVWSATAGMADIGTEEPVTDAHLFPVASLTKTFTAALVHREIETGAFTLATPVADIVPALGMDPSVQVRHVLDHTSGLVDYATIEGYSAVSAGEMVPADIVALALTEPLAVQPGSELHYSNTNYIVAGMLLEASTGTPYVDLLRQDLLDPLGITGAALQGEEELPGPMVEPHTLAQPTTPPHTDWMWAAWGLAATSQAACAWFDELLEPGNVLNEASVEAMLVRPALASGGISPFGPGLKVIEAGGLEVVGYAAATSGSGGFAYLHRPTGTCAAMYVNEWAFDRNSTIEEIWTRLVESAPEHFGQP